jgi:tetratricopeptide (TPR) repeat protein/tRNA A-37 threonylcarbamoyl transferase component Bud32
MMTPERWRQIKDCFDAVVDVPSADRSSVMARVCAGDAELRAEIERLIDEHESAGDFLTEPVIRTTSLAEGEVIMNRYRIIGLIGRGGMGEVYRAHDQLLKETVALKTLRIDLASDEALVKRFQKEIELARKVTHTNVCRIFEVGIYEFKEVGRPALFYFTMELLNGETVSARVQRQGPFSNREAFPIAIQIAEGLHAAHKAGIVHADFKSGNIILVSAESGERAVITDFGLARYVAALSDSDETRTMADPPVRAGTVGYMSPEQLRGESITPASDIYSLGIVYFEMATGRLPFDDQDLIRSAMQRVSGESKSVRSISTTIDPRWASAIERCLRTEPQNRFRSAASAADWLRGMWWMPNHWTQREWIRAAMTAVIALASMLGLWLWLYRPYQPSPIARQWYQKGVEALHSMTYETARRRFEQAIIADPKFALAHASLARAYDELDYTDLAKDSMLRAVAIAEQSRLSADDERKLHVQQFMVSRDYEHAARLMQQIEKAASIQERPAAELESGWLAQLREDTKEAAAAYERAVKLDPRYAAAKLRLGYIFGRLGQRDDQAFEAFVDAERLYNASSDFEGVAETLYQRANLLTRRSRDSEAMPIIDRALAVAHAVGNHYQQIELESLQSRAARNVGDNQRAAILAHDAIDEAIAERMDNLAISGLIDLGNSFLGRGDTASAEPSYRQAMTLAQRNGVRRLEARAQASLASLAEQNHRPEDVKGFITQSLAFYRRAGYTREAVQASGVLASAHFELGEYQDGIRVVREALEKAAPLHDSRLEAQLRERLAENLRGQGDWPSALAEYERTTSLYGPGVRGQIQRLQCGQLYFLLGRQEDFGRSLDDVQEFLRKRPDRGLQYELKALRAKIEYAGGHFAQAQGIVGELLSMPARDEATARELKLTRALVLMRMGQIPQGSDLASSIIAEMEKSKLAGDAAYARLSTAEALALSGEQAQALRWALDGLSFFEPRDIWEAIVRGHLVAARACRDPLEANKHILAARAAFTLLKTLWPPGYLDGYRKRLDFQQLVGRIVL